MCSLCTMYIAQVNTQCIRGVRFTCTCTLTCTLWRPPHAGTRTSADDLRTVIVVYVGVFKLGFFFFVVKSCTPLLNTSRIRAEYTVGNVETATALSRANIQQRETCTWFYPQVIISVSTPLQSLKQNLAKPRCWIYECFLISFLFHNVTVSSRVSLVHRRVEYSWDGRRGGCSDRRRSDGWRQRGWRLTLHT